MDWSTIFATVLQLLLSAVAAVVTKRLLVWQQSQKKWRGRRPVPPSKGDQPRRRRQPRPRAYRVMELSRLDRSRGLEQYIAARGLVPLERRRPESRLRAAGNAVSQFFFATRVIPKPGFRISGWQCHPIPGSAAIVGSFLLAIRLHPNENRRHLVASMRSLTVFSDRARLVAIASIPDLFDEESHVRCYTVDTSTTSFNGKDHEMIGVQSCDGVRYGVPTHSTRRVGEVPDDALWLITDNPAHTAPSKNRDSSAAELYETQDDPIVPQADPSTRQELDDDYRYIRRTVRRAIITKDIIWLGTGLGVVLTITAMRAVAGLPDSVADQILMFWFVTWLIMFWLYLAVSIGELIQKWWWRWGDRQRCDGDTVWWGGTTDCLIFGDMVWRGRVLNRKEWKRFWRSMQPEE